MTKRLNFVLYAFIYEHKSLSLLKLNQGLEIFPGEEKRKRKRGKQRKGNKEGN